MVGSCYQVGHCGRLLLPCGTGCEYQVGCRLWWGVVTGRHYQVGQGVVTR